MKMYAVKLKHDGGTKTIEVNAVDGRTAVDTVMKVEGCPRRAIISFVLVNKIAENNKLIAKFMGLTQGRKDTIRWEHDWFDDEGTINGVRNTHLLFHDSWDWLMVVVEKVESLGQGVTIYRKGCQINGVFITVTGFNHSSKIGETYKAVVEFINWYNINKIAEEEND